MRICVVSSWISSLLIRGPAGSPLFPYTTLFRSSGARAVHEVRRAGEGVERRAIAEVRDDRAHARGQLARVTPEDRKSTRLNSSHSQISYAVFCLKKKTQRTRHRRAVRSHRGLPP